MGRLPDAVIACVGGGSNAIGIFYPFVAMSSVQTDRHGSGRTRSWVRGPCGAFQWRIAGRSARAFSYLVARRRGPGWADAFGFGGFGLCADRAGTRMAARQQPGGICFGERCGGAGSAQRRWRSWKELFRRSNLRMPWRKRFGARPRERSKIYLVNVSGRGDKDIDIYRENMPELDV